MSLLLALLPGASGEPPLLAPVMIRAAACCACRVSIGTVQLHVRRHWHGTVVHNIVQHAKLDITWGDACHIKHAELSTISPAGSHAGRPLIRHRPERHPP